VYSSIALRTVTISTEDLAAKTRKRLEERSDKTRLPTPLPLHLRNFVSLSLPSKFFHKILFWDGVDIYIFGVCVLSNSTNEGAKLPRISIRGVCNGAENYRPNGSCARDISIFGALYKKFHAN